MLSCLSTLLVVSIQWSLSCGYVLTGAAELSHVKCLVSSSWLEYHLPFRPSWWNSRSWERVLCCSRTCVENQDSDSGWCGSINNSKDSWFSSRHWPACHRKNVNCLLFTCSWVNSNRLLESCDSSNRIFCYTCHFNGHFVGMLGLADCVIDTLLCPKR